ncbi:zinc-binding dehydrogenase [Archangium violaceum]|uniref:zinc-binding dehydrogenase n=1 Tax=Archangium violaceum TaxID=83451 RepID=UPI00193B9DFB|nr:zinc-binding dehydrogenase [Archangium violaceum]QRK08229.1 zinc-binding dehydrogenase [Archangium violaceum]
MNTQKQEQGLALRSRVSSQGELELSLARVAIPDPAPDEVVIRVEASPINPSDLGLLLGPADMSTARAGGTAESPVVTATIPQPLLKALAPRLDKSLPVGNEGAGVVIKAGANARELLGRTVAALAGGMYSQYRVLKASHCLVLPEDATPAEGASSFVNPLTALGMVETMRREGHKALVHTAAASNLGQMLNKICLADGIGLVNIVRNPEQVALLRDLGAVHVYDSTSSTFTEDLTRALVETGATLAFDATGGGQLAGQILACMEAAANRTATTYSPYGSTIHKQVYIYGKLDPRPIELGGNFGMAWGVGGWLLTPFLEKIGPQAAQKLRDRVAAELKTTFASHYAAELSLAEALRLDMIAVYSKRATGKKYLINPNKGLR